jgi:mediator of RNA polymerase II transcription subunit 5
MLSEYQPSYEDFSSIFLLVLAMVYLYDLSALDLGIAEDSFVAKYLKQGHKAQSQENFTEGQTKQLSTWIKLLFNADSISDDLLSTCRPQEFYLLVPTILSQIIFAQAAGLIVPAGLTTPLECMFINFGLKLWLTQL